MHKFWQLLAESVIIRGMLALLFSATVCVMYLRGQDVPEALVNAIMLILGSLFQAAVAASVKKITGGK